MASPPPPGPFPGQEAATGAGSSGSRPGAASQGRAGRSPRRHGHSERPLRGALIWLPLGLSTMLLVLLAVVINRQQAQAERIGSLLDRVQDLEHSRALERTAVLEQQLRSMLTRVQTLEKGEQQALDVGRRLQALQEELQQVRSAAGRPLGAPAEATDAPPPAPLPRPASAPPASP